MYMHIFHIRQGVCCHHPVKSSLLSGATPWILLTRILQGTCLDSCRLVKERCVYSSGVAHVLPALSISNASAAGQLYAHIHRSRLLRSMSHCAQQSAPIKWLLQLLLQTTHTHACPRMLEQLSALANNKCRGYQGSTLLIANSVLLV